MSKCKECEKDISIMKKDDRREFCSKPCIARFRYKKKKEEIIKSSTKICELPGCKGVIRSILKSTRTCSYQCGYELRSMEFHPKTASRAGENPLNSSSNELIRNINRFLLAPSVYVS